MQIKEVISANGRLEYTEVANFVRILDAEHTVLTLEFYRNGSLVGKVGNIGAGYAEGFDQNIDRIVVTSEVEQKFSIVMRLGSDVRYDTPPNGNVRITNANGEFIQSVKTVSNVQGSLLEANASRRYLLIQNNDPAYDIYINLSGGAAENGLKIDAGGSYELTNFVTTNEITAVSPDGENASIVVIEG